MRAEQQAVVLVIEDEASLQSVLRVALAANDFRVLEATTARAGIEQAAKHNPDAVFLDLGLPDLDGTVVIRRIREWSDVPIIVVSARADEKQKIEALDAGADDYLTKPFAMGELFARLRSALRHAARAHDGTDAEPVIEVGELRVDLARQQAFVRGRRVHLSPREHALFAVLMKHAGKVLTHRQLLEHVWGPEHVDRVEYIRVHIAALRRKLEAEPARPKYLLAEPGIGYRLRG